MNVYINLGSMVILTILILLIHEHSISFHLFVLFNFFKLLLKYSFLPLPPALAQSPSPPHLPPVSKPSPRYCPCVLYNCSCKPFTLSPLNSLPFLLCSLQFLSSMSYSIQSTSLSPPWLNLS